jgi:hypothetical protein
VRIGLVVDGIGEANSLPHLLPRIDTQNVIVPTVVKGDIQPRSAPSQIALAAANACRTFMRRQLDLVVLLIDLEDRGECPTALAAALRPPFARQISRIGLNVNIEVVVKSTRLENWLVADLECLVASPRLFPELGRVRQRVPVGNADGVDGLAVLETASGPRQTYHKVRGAESICRYLDPGRAARNSRSFRRFLRVLGDSRYADQSRLPNTAV